MMRCTMLELLTWTYRDELPKRDRLGFGDGWGAVERYADGGGYDVEPMPRLPAAVGAPHPDAETVAAAVMGLGSVDLAEISAAGLKAAAEAAELLLGPIARAIGPEQLGQVARRSVNLPVALQSLALGVLKPPRREAWTPEPLCDADGKPVEAEVAYRKVSVRVDGRTIRLRVMISGHCPIRWAPQPAMVFEERLRWHVVVDALERLSLSLGPQLMLWRIDGLGVAVEPWRGDVDRALKGRLLPDLGQAAAPAARTNRGRPPKRSIGPRQAA